MRVRLVWCLLVCIGCMVGVSNSDAADGKEALCKSLFRQKRNLEAAKCFAGLAESVSDAALKKDEFRNRKGRWLRNASVLMARAAKNESVPAKKSYYIEQASLYARSYLKQKLFETKHQQRIMKLRLVGLENKIGYTLLSVTTRQLKAKIQVSGFKFDGKGAGAWSQKVRPGNYVVRVTYPKAPVEIKTIKLVAGTPQVASFTPPTSSAIAKRPIPRRLVAVKPRTRAPGANTPKPSVVPMALIVSGAILLVGGGVALAVGGVNYSTASGMCGGFPNGVCQPSGDANATAANFNQSAGAATAMFGLGGAGAGVGAALLLTGIVLQSSAK